MILQLSEFKDNKIKAVFFTQVQAEKENAFFVSTNLNYILSSAVEVLKIP